MSIAFDPTSVAPALIGGALIGAAAALLVLFNGRVAGISGIVGGLLGGPFTRGEWAWRAAFVVGLIGAPLAWVAWRGGTTIRIDSGSGALIVAGLLVATGLFMAAGMAVVALVRHGVAA